MRKYLIILFVFCLLLLCGCGAAQAETEVLAEEPAAEEPAEEAIPVLTFDSFVFEYGGITLEPGDVYDFSLFDDTEDPVTTPDCRTGSDATEYTYNGFTINTVQLQDAETGETKAPYISSISISGADIPAQGGLTVGSSRDSVTEVCGSGYEEAFGGYLYRSTGDTTLTFYFDDDGNVSFIVYSLDESLFDSSVVPTSEEQTSLRFSENPDSGITFSGLDTLYIDYYAYRKDASAADYLSGVIAKDRNGNQLELTYELYYPTLVKNYGYGPGYVVLTATDADGNTNSAVRPYFLEEFGETEEAYIAELAEKIGSDDPVEIKQYITDHVPYAEEYRCPSPIGGASLYRTGNCYVHARLLQEVLRYHGYDTRMVWSSDSRHYWVLVYLEVDGEYCWRHLDATPLNYYQNLYTGLMTDEERLAMLHGHTFDTEFWPAAE